MDIKRGWGFGMKRIGWIGCREINAERGRWQNFNLRNDRLKNRTKTHAVQKKCCTNTGGAQTTKMTNQRKEIILAEALRKMLDSGKIIYGYEFEGKWLECGTKLSWLESSFYLSLKHPEFGEKLKGFLNKENL